MAAKTKVQLPPQEEQEMREGMALYELTQSAGWKIVERWLNDRAFHTWADPRETEGAQQWQWRELNAFHASNNAKELVEAITQAISRAEYLQKVASGEIKNRAGTRL
jgi:hypothetical protein